MSNGITNEELIEAVRLLVEVVRELTEEWENNPN